MQLLVVGLSLPNPRIDNYSFTNAPAFFDYDAMLIDPLSVSTVIEGLTSGGESFGTAAGEPVVNAAIAGVAVGLGDFLRRRRSEIERLLARGGTVAVFARPNQEHPHIAGFPGADRYSWLPAPAGLAFREPYLVPAFGTQVVVTDSASPYAPFIDGYRQWFHYRAYFSERWPEFASGAHVFSRSVGSAAVGVEFRHGPGRIVFLPAMFEVPAGDPRFKLASTLLECLRSSVHEAPAGEVPDWTSEIELPGLTALQQAEDEAARRLQEADQQHSEAQARRNQVARYRSLLWQEGRWGLELVVRDAFHLLGFTVNFDLDRPAELQADGVTAFLEVEGATDQVVEYPYFRLQKRLERDLLETRQPKKGIIVVNGFRLTPPGERGQQYTDALRVASENYRYALLTTRQLLELVRAALSDNSDESLRQLRSRVLATDGPMLG